VIEELDSCQREFDLFTADPQQTEEHIARLTEDTRIIAEERVQIAEQLRALQIRYDEVIA